MTTKEFYRLKQFIVTYKEKIYTWEYYIISNQEEMADRKKLQTSRPSDFGKLLFGELINSIYYKYVQYLKLWANVYINKNRETKVFHF